MFRRLFGLDETASPALPMLAAVVGATLFGRSNPHRSLCGYVLASRTDRREDWRLGPALITRDEFGDGAPALHTDIHCVRSNTAWRLQRLDALYGLRTGDVVLLGHSALTGALADRLNGRLTRHASGVHFADDVS